MSEQAGPQAPDSQSPKPGPAGANDPQSAEKTPTTSVTSQYQAPYYRNGDEPTGLYLVKFKDGHDIEKHLAFLKRVSTFEKSACGDFYLAAMDEKLFDAVRCDPGVEFIEDPPEGGEEDSATQDDHTKSSPGRVEAPQTVRTSNTESQYQAPYLRNCDPPTGTYLVKFNKGHTLEKHLAFLGRRFELMEFPYRTGYAADMDAELHEAVRRDPGLEFIEDAPDDGEEE